MWDQSVPTKKKKKIRKKFFFWFLHPKLDVRFSSWEDPSRFRMAYKQEMIDSIYQKPKVCFNILFFKTKPSHKSNFELKNPSVSLYSENNFDMLLYLKLKVFYLLELKKIYELLYLLKGKPNSLYIGNTFLRNESFFTIVIIYNFVKISLNQIKWYYHY